MTERAKNQQLRDDLGAALRERRQELELSLAECSRRAGLGQGALSLIESGKRGCGLHVFWALAFALELDPSELMQRVEEAEAQ